MIAKKATWGTSTDPYSATLDSLRSLLGGEEGKERGIDGEILCETERELRITRRQSICSTLLCWLKLRRDGLNHTKASFSLIVGSTTTLGWVCCVTSTVRQQARYRCGYSFLPSSSSFPDGTSEPGLSS
ncbi:hypothetical protein B0T13DRAFT_469707 [Neurospora crassa]|nr:hypothetical protein B0T13DRAFT_469707 [Neurospora crassa]